MPLFQSESNSKTILMIMRVHMNVVPRSTMNTNGEAENYL